MTEHIQVKVLKDISFRTEAEGWSIGAEVQFPDGSIRNVWLLVKGLGGIIVSNKTFEEAIREEWARISGVKSMREKIAFMIRQESVLVDVTNPWVPKKKVYDEDE